MTRDNLVRLKSVAENPTIKAGDRTHNFVALEDIESGTGRVLIETLPNASSNGGVRYEPGDVLFGKLRPYLAKAMSAIASGVCSSELLVIRPNSDLESRFLLYTTLSLPWLTWAEQTSYGSKMPRTSWEELSQYRLSLPPLDEQRRIVDFLDSNVSRLDRLVTALRKKKNIIDERRFAAIRATLHGSTRNSQVSRVPWLRSHPPSWDAIPLRYLARIQRGASPRPIDDPAYFDESGHYAWVRISDVTASGKYLKQTTQKLSRLGQSLSVPLQPGELFVSIAASVGKPTITTIPCCIHDGFVALRDPSVEPEYLYYVLLLGDAFAGLGKLGTQLNLNSGTIGSIIVPVPSKEERQGMLRRLRAVDDLARMAKELTDRQLELLAERRQALITAAITGQIDVTTARGVRD